ncbi:hypothetical protein CDO73_09280 [Saccharibacillus sp. O23]|nr:hypothetical protein CDO73_09280 [Saccharibacillus sp. O23]
MKRAFQTGMLAFGIVLAAGCSSASTDADMRHDADQAMQTASDQLNNLADMNDERVLSVKNGTMNGRSDVTLGEAMEAFFDGPTWHYFSGTDDETEETHDVVEFTGYFMYNEKSAKARIQFILHEDDTFEMGAGSYNDIDQSALVLGALMDKVYESYDADHAPTASAAQANEDVEAASVKAENAASETTPARSNAADAAPTGETPESEISQSGESTDLNDFERWNAGETDLALSIVLDGEPLNVIIGQDTPNGVKTIVFSDTMKQGWNLPVEVADANFSPFDDFGDLKEGFSLFVTKHDFAGDGVPEVVLAASDGMLETYVWVYNYDYTFSEYDAPPLSLAWYGEGQSGLQLNGDRIELPYGSQGLVDEYVYDGMGFVDQ